jgi:hypothetical protein
MIQLPQHFNVMHRRVVFLTATLFLMVSFLHIANAGTLSCTVATTCPSGTVIYRMSGLDNAHAELASQANYSQLVCCSGVSSLGNSCSGTYDTALKLSATTNAHAEQNSQSNYAQSACISVPSGGTVSVGYQSTNCSGFDTTLGSMSGTTNAHVGDGSAYTTKICATATGVSQSLSFNISDNSIGFGTLSASVPRYATGDNSGSASVIEAHTISAATNAASGYVMTLNGATLTSGLNSITAIGASNTTSSAGTEQFGLRMTASGGSGTVTAPYAASGFAFDSAAFPDEVAAATASSANTTYSVRYVANITAQTQAGAYTATLTYIATANF